MLVNFRRPDATDGQMFYGIKIINCLKEIFHFQYIKIIDDLRYGASEIDAPQMR